MRLYCNKTIKKRIQNSLLFIDKYIVPYCSSVDDQYDTIICGSDQIWRKQPEKFGYNQVYFGLNNINAIKQISYAASMGTLPNSLKDKNIIKELISNLCAISVRESDLKTLLNNMGFNNVHTSLDPTLLLSAKQWNLIIPEERPAITKYALFYEVVNQSFDEESMRVFCKNNGLKLVIVRTKPVRYETDFELYSISADKFVNYIRFADFVFTSSFHGLAFSIINHKNFLCSVSSTNKIRLLSLLDKLEITGHYIEPMAKIPMEINKINYEIIELKLRQLCFNSVEYLKNNLKK